MATSLPHSSPTSINQALFLSSLPQKHHRCRRFSLLARAHLQQAQPSSTLSYSQDIPGRRHVLAASIIVPWVSLVSQNYVSAAETKKGFLSFTDQNDGYTFLYPFGWQEVIIDGQDKVFKDVIEPLESVSVTVIPTNKQDIREFGSPEQVAATLIKKVLAPPNQKTKLVEAKEHDVDGKAYYTFEFTAQAPNYTRHALSTISVGNGKFYTLTTGANQRRWNKIKDNLQIVVDSFKLAKI